MRKWLKGLAAVALALAGVGAALYSAAAWMGERKMRRSVEVRVVPVAFARDAAAARLGKTLYEARGCADCHGADGAGRVLIDDPGGLQVRAPNITPGEGSPVAGYGEGDWVRAVRHGVDPGGRPLLAMPSEQYNRWSDAELAALVAYVRRLPPVAGGSGFVRMPMHLKALYGAGAVRDAAERIDHRKPPPATALPEAADPAADYLAQLRAWRRLNDMDAREVALHLAGVASAKAPAP